MKKIIFYSLMFLIFSLTALGCSKDEETKKLEAEISQGLLEVSSLIEESKSNGNTINESIYPILDGYTSLVLTYYARTGEIEEDTLDKTIGFLEYYRDYGQYYERPSSFQVTLPVLYSINASLKTDDFTSATEQVKLSINGYDELLDDHPDDLIVLIYQAISLSQFPPYFQVKEKALLELEKVTTIIEEQGLEERIPLGLLKNIYQNGYRLADELDSPKDGLEELFLKKKQELEKKFQNKN